MTTPTNTPTSLMDELRELISSSMHQIKTRSLRDAPVYLNHVSMAESELYTKLIARERSIKETVESCIVQYGDGTDTAVINTKLLDERLSALHPPIKSNGDNNE